MAPAVQHIPDDIFQYSLHGAFLAGLTTSGPTATALSGYGTHGIGHIARPTGSDSGDLLLLDGIPYVLHDGEFRECGRETCLAFVMVTKFLAESRDVVDGLKMEGLVTVFGSQGADRGGVNSLIPFSLYATFTSVVLQEKVVRDVKGMILGFHIPKWAYGMSSPGESVRGCFLEDAKTARRRGGFVKDFEVDGKATVEWAVTGRFHLGLPQGKTWQEWQLS